MARRKSEVQKAAEKAVKKTHTATVVLVVLFFLIGCIGGVFVSMQLTKNDKFELKGDKTVYLQIGEAYSEAGVEIVSFGKDISAKVTYSGDYDSLDTATEGVYQIVYKVEDLRWGNFQRVRTVVVGNPDQEDETDPADVTHTEDGNGEE